MMMQEINKSREIIISAFIYTAKTRDETVMSDDDDARGVNKHLLLKQKYLCGKILTDSGIVENMSGRPVVNTSGMISHIRTTYFNLRILTGYTSPLSGPLARMPGDDGGLNMATVKRESVAVDPLAVLSTQPLCEQQSDPPNAVNMMVNNFLSLCR